MLFFCVMMNVHNSQFGCVLFSVTQNGIRSENLSTFTAIGRPRAISCECVCEWSSVMPHMQTIKNTMRTKKLRSTCWWFIRSDYIMHMQSRAMLRKNHWPLWFVVSLEAEDGSAFLSFEISSILSAFDIAVVVIISIKIENFLTDLMTTEEPEVKVFEFLFRFVSIPFY